VSDSPYRGPRASAWPRRLTQGPSRIIAAGELGRWIIHEDDHLLVVDKPGDVVCHPSKHGPNSSLVGAAREHTGLETIHLVFRLDRETSGVVVLAKEPATARRLQVAMQERRIKKAYYALLAGELDGPVVVDQPLGDDTASPVFIKSAVRTDGQPSVTRFETLSRAGGFTLARVITDTGRKHQIRAHAQWLGFPVVGDKIYGPDARLYLEFIGSGWTPELAARLLLERQALHCAWISLEPAGIPLEFEAPLPADMRAFGEARGLDLRATGSRRAIQPPSESARSPDSADCRPG
jgi:23S rRNA pseudouridine1911/1915/1917 synthase